MTDSFSPPQQVRANAARSLELRRKHNRGMTAVGVARARDLSNGKNISADTIKRMHSYFARHEVDKKGKDWANQSNPSAGYIAWLGWGGDAGRSWVNGIIKKLDAKESQENPTMASTKAATIRGIFLKPGLSKNRRLYTRGNIAKAVERMQGQIQSGEGMPLNMATSHAAAFQDDATSTVGRITNVKLLADGSAQFEAEIANTAHGRDVANLAAGKFIKGVSIRGEWRGNPETVVHTDGQEATTADDLAIHGIDFTNSPGVEGAEIQYASLAESHNKLAIFESVETVEVVSRDEEMVAYEAADVIRDAVETAVEDAVNSIFEKDASKPYGNVTYADPGYQKDKKKRYPIDTAAHIRAAWSYINQGDNASLYTTAQLSRVKSRIKSAAKKFGINIVSEQEQLANDFQEILEAYASISLVNDYDTINVTGQTNDPHKLRIVANRIAFGAIAAMHAIDPDDDGDIYLSKPDWSQVDATGDAGGMGPEDESMEDDNNMECEHCGAPGCPADAEFCPSCGEAVSTPSMMTRECESCGTECHEDSIHCHMCGAPLPTSMTANALGCGNCGEVTPQDAMYCPTCGDPVPQAEASKKDYSKIIPNRKGEPADKKLYAAVLADAKKKFDVYPSAVANAWASQEYKKRGGTYTTKSAESSDNAPTQEMETEVSDENTTEEVAAEITAVETPAEEATLETAATRTLSDADLQALAAMIVAAQATKESDEVVADAEVAPEAEAEAAEEIAAEEVAAEESHESKEITVTENTFTMEQVQAMVAEAAAAAATAAVAEAKKSAVENYRNGNTVYRKGLTSTSVGNDASDLSESEELDPRQLAEMNSSAFRKVQNEVWGSTPFFANKFAQADRGF